MYIVVGIVEREELVRDDHTARELANRFCGARPFEIRHQAAAPMETAMTKDRNRQSDLAQERGKSMKQRREQIVERFFILGDVMSFAGSGEPERLNAVIGFGPLLIGNGLDRPANSVGSGIDGDIAGGTEISDETGLDQLTVALVQVLIFEQERGRGMLGEHGVFPIGAERGGVKRYETEIDRLLLADHPIGAFIADRPVNELDQGVRDAAFGGEILEERAVGGIGLVVLDGDLLPFRNGRFPAGPLPVKIGGDAGRFVGEPFEAGGANEVRAALAPEANGVEEPGDMLGLKRQDGNGVEPDIFLRIGGAGVTVNPERE